MTRTRVPRLFHHARRVTLGAHADHGHAAPAEHQWISNRDDSHRPGLHQPLDALADGGVGQLRRCGQAGVGQSSVLLQLLDDRSVGVVEVLTAAPQQVIRQPR